MSDEQQTTERDRARAARVAALVRELAETINTGPVDERELLRDVAVDLLREDVRGGERSAPSGLPTPRADTFNPFGIGIPLILMGGVLIFLFPPVGLLMFAAAAVMILWGVGATLLARS